MATKDPATTLALAFKQLSEAFSVASSACKDLEYTLPSLAAKTDAFTAVIPQAPMSTTTATTAAQQAPPKKIKRVRDPDEPRRPPSAYLVFLETARQDLKKSEPELKNTEVMTKLASKWNELSNA